MQTHIFFHSNCFDGFTAAWAAWRRFGDEAEYKPCSYAQSIDIEKYKNCRIYFVDFSAKRAILNALAEHNEVYILDHHATAEKDLEGIESLKEDDAIDTIGDCITPGLKVRFDMKKSGAMIAWQYFNPYTPHPELVQYVQDRDLWDFKLGGSREVSAYLRCFEFNFQEWEKVYSMLENDLGGFIDKGEVVLQHDKMTVGMICKKAQLVNFRGDTVALVNTSSHWSEVGEKLLSKFPHADYAMSFTCLMKHRSFMASLRARKGGHDVSVVADGFGGGGHRPAAGFNLSLEEGFKLISEMEPINESKSS